MAKNLIPRGIRNNNPGNLRDLGIKYKGLIGRDKDGFCIFDTMANGLRAMSLNIQSYFNKHGINTISGIAKRWSPASENDLPNVISNLSKLSGFKPNESIDLDLPKNRERVMTAIARNENGTIFSSYISPSDISLAAIQRSV